MDAVFETGSQEAPKGHALLYFRDQTDPERFLATYLVVLPIAIDPARWLPPAFAGRMPTIGAIAATALPPIPEPVGDLDQLRRIAQHRSDDILDGGTLDPTDAERLIYTTQELAQAYAKLYQEATDHWASAPVEEPDGEDARLLLMSELDRLRELARLTGQLRYALEGEDQQLAEQTLGQVTRVVQLLPEKYHLADFTSLVQEPGDRGRRLAALLLDRSFKLCNEQYEALARLDKEIEHLRRDSGSGA